MINGLILLTAIGRVELLKSVKGTSSFTSLIFFLVVLGRIDLNYIPLTILMAEMSRLSSYLSSRLALSVRDLGFGGNSASISFEVQIE